MGRLAVVVLAAAASGAACAHSSRPSPELSFDTTAARDLLEWARSNEAALPTRWRGCKAYALTRAWAEWSGQPDPDLEVMQVLAKLGEGKLARGGGKALHKIEEFMIELDQKRPGFMARATPLLNAYLPPGTAVRGNVLFAMFIRPYAFAWGDGSIVVNLTAGHFDYEADRVFDVLVHELFHTGFASHQTGGSPLAAEDPAELLEGILWQTQNEGIATYVAYRARPEGLFVEDYAMIEDGVTVAHLFQELGRLINDAGAADPDQLEPLKSRTFTLGSRDRGFYVVGAVMAQQIERNLGRAALVETIKHGPRAFFEAYHQSHPVFPMPIVVAAGESQ